uniref:Uncharacterized protein n=1 Tax=Setaria italica TaxID=4555 RepID=K3YP34_SETIT
MTRKKLNLWSLDKQYALFQGSDDRMVQVARWLDVTVMSKISISV